jgi:hypothetical protein
MTFLDQLKFGNFLFGQRQWPFIVHLMTFFFIRSAILFFFGGPLKKIPPKFGEPIRPYLSHRYQRVCVDEKISDSVLVARGVVQGSVLGPLLFSLFISDIASKISHCRCRYHLYAHDVRLYLSGDIDSISDCINRLNLNFINVLLKTAFVLISLAADAPAIYLAGQQVLYSKSGKNLGLVLNNAFSWENQVNLICGRVYFALRRLWSTASHTFVGTIMGSTTFFLLRFGLFQNFSGTLSLTTSGIQFLC